MEFSSTDLSKIQEYHWGYYFFFFFFATKHKEISRGAVAEWLAHSTVVRKVANLNLSQVNDWKTLIVHPAVNGYLIQAIPKK